MICKSSIFYNTKWYLAEFQHLLGILQGVPKVCILARRGRRGRSRGGSPSPGGGSIIFLRVFDRSEVGCANLVQICIQIGTVRRECHFRKDFDMLVLACVNLVYFHIEYGTVRRERLF